MQKTYTSAFLTKTMADNNGELDQFCIKDNHTGIISREDWDAVQLELERREKFRADHVFLQLRSVLQQGVLQGVWREVCPESLEGHEGAVLEMRKRREEKGEHLLGGKCPGGGFAAGGGHRLEQSGRTP